MELESKQATVEAKAIDDAEGIVEAVVSVTNIVDNVKDVIVPGDYEDTLQKRITKGVWSHDTTVPVARTVSAVELPPGSDKLPSHLQEQDAGGVLVKMQFNLNTSRGRDAYEDIKFFGGEQEWSIGYSVPEGGSEMKEDTGIRHIKRLEWYEYSPVLFGAAPGTHTVSVKDVPVGAGKASEPDEEKGPIASHAVGFADDRPWKPAMYKSVRSPADKAYYSKIFAFLKDGEDPTFKTNYSFIHHYVSSDGSPGAAALGGLREGIGSLNGARGGSVLRGSDRKGVYNHLARHYRESGEKPLDLKSDEEMEEILELKASLTGFDCKEIDALIDEGAGITEIKSTLEDIMANEAEITETTEATAVVIDDGQGVQSAITDAITALNTLSERLGSLEEKGGDAPGFSNTDPDSSERADGAGADAPEVVEDLRHGGTLTPEQMAVEGSPAGGDAKPAKKPKAEEAPAAEEEVEKSDESVSETADEESEEAKATEPTSVLGSLDLAELREFQDLVSYSALGE